MPKKSSISIKIDPELWKTAKIEAVKHNITLTELLEEAIRDYIEKRRTIQ